jgi:hypothetical protein
LNPKEIAKSLLWGVLTFFAFLGYISEFRPYLETKLGAYVLGFVDGAVAVAVFLVAAFYVASIFEKEPSFKERSISQGQHVEPAPKIAPAKVEKRVIEELIRRCESIKKIVSTIHERAGDHFFKTMVEVSSGEEVEYEEHMKWLQTNYPRVSPELNRATRITYVDPFLGTKVENYDPLLQTFHYSTLERVFENSFDLRKFEKDLEGGIARLRAYLGIL